MSSSSRRCLRSGRGGLPTWPHLSAGQSVLDVACGTGVLAREAFARVQPGGAVVGLDCNAGMLDVAGRNSPGIQWRQGQAEALPFPDCSFDGGYQPVRSDVL